MTRLLLEWVVTASLLILAAIALRTLLGRHISAGLRYALWAVVLVRLLVPLQFYSLSVLMALPEADREPVTTNAAPAATVPALQGEAVGAPVIAAPHPGGVAANYDATDTPSTAILDVTHLWGVLGWLWLAGAAVMTAAFFFSNLAFALRLRRVRVPLEGADCPLPVYLAENLPSPCLFGLVRPSVYVTAESTQYPAMLRHILAHEYTHFRHGDYGWNLLRSAALAIHWWNPLVWLAIILNRRDCELACDEGTLKRLGDDERIAYGRTLLALISVKPRPGDLLRCATTMTSGQKSVFDRITRIAHAPKRWLWATVVVVITTALASVCAFGQAESVEPSNHVGEITPTYTMNEIGDGAGTVIVEGLGGAYAEWRGPDASPPGDWLYFSDPAFCCPSLAGKQIDGDAMWTDETRTAVAVTMGASDNYTLLNSDAGLYINFAVELDSGTVLHKTFLPEGETLELTDQEMVNMARVLAKLLTGAEDYYQSHSEALSSQPVLELPGVRQEGDFSNSVELAVSDGKRLTLVMREPLDKQNGNSLRTYNEFQVFDGDTLIQTITQDDVIRDDSYLFEGFLVDYGSLTVQDVSFDGAEDFGVVCGSTYNGPRCWFVWNQAAGQFRFSFFSSWDLRVDRDKNQLTDVWRNGNVGTDYYIYEFDDHGDRVQIDHYFEAIR